MTSVKLVTMRLELSVWYNVLECLLGSRLWQMLHGLLRLFWEFLDEEDDWRDFGKGIGKSRLNQFEKEFILVNIFAISHNNNPIYDRNYDDIQDEDHVGADEVSPRGAVLLSSVSRLNSVYI